MRQQVETSRCFAGSGLSRSVKATSMKSKALPRRGSAAGTCPYTLEPLERCFKTGSLKKTCSFTLESCKLITR